VLCRKRHTARKELASFLLFPAWGREEGHHKIRETDESERYNEHAFTRSRLRMPAGSSFRIFRGFPSPVHRPRCIVAGEKRHIPIHDCIRIVKEGGRIRLHSQYVTFFPVWGVVPHFSVRCRPERTCPRLRPARPPTVNPVADTAPKVDTGCQGRLTECSFLALPLRSCRPGRKKASSAPSRGLFPFPGMS